MYSVKQLKNQDKIHQKFYNFGYNVVPLIGKITKGFEWESYKTDRLPKSTLEFYNNRTNWGLLTGNKPYNDTPAIIVVDADDAPAMKYVEEHCPTTPIKQRTGKGGIHYIYRRPESDIPITNRQKYVIDKENKLNIDLRGDGGYIVMPNSIHPDTKKLYQEIDPWELEYINQAPIFDINWFPNWFKELEKKEIIKKEINVQENLKISQAKKKLENCGGAIEGRGADNYCLALAINLVQDYALEEQDAINLLYEWGQQKTNVNSMGWYYPWSLKEIEHKIQSAIIKIDNNKLGSALLMPYECPIDAIIKEVDPSNKKLDLLLTWQQYKEKYGNIKYDYIIDEILPKVGITLFCGASFAGKTTLTDYMIACICENNEFFGYNCKPQRIILLDYEFNHTLRIPRILKYTDDEHLDKYFFPADADKLPNPLTAKDLEPYLTEPSLVIIDTFTSGLMSSLKAGDDKDGIAMVQLLNPFKTLAHNTNSAILLLHHNNRQDEFAGSARTPATATATWHYNKIEHSDNKLFSIQTREKKLIPFEVELNQDGEFNIANREFKLKKWVDDMPLNTPMTIKDIANLNHFSGKSTTTVTRAAKQAVTHGLITLITDKRKNHYTRII